MKIQTQYDVMDPEVPSPKPGFVLDESDDPDDLNDAYVIGEGGNTVKAPEVDASIETQAGPKAWAMPVASVLSALFVVLTIWNLSRLMQGPPPPPKPSPFQVKQALYLGVMRIDAYRRVHGVTPEALSDAGLPDTGAYGYRRIDPAHYVLSFRGDGPKLEYDSNDAKELFFGSPKEILSMGGSR